MMIELTLALLSVLSNFASQGETRRTHSPNRHQNAPQRPIKNTLLEKTSKPASTTLRQNLQTCHDNKDAAKAIVSCTRLLDTHLQQNAEPKTRLYVHRGNAHLKLQHYDEALADYNDALKIRPKYPQAYFYRGSAKSRQGHHQQAIADYGRAIALKPDFIEAYFNRGTAHGRLKQFLHAIADLSTVIGFKPGLAKAYANRGATYALMGRSKKALADLNQALLLKPDQSVAHLNRAGIYRKQGQLQKAFEDYRAGFQASPRARIQTLQKRLKKNDDYHGRLDGSFDQMTQNALQSCLQKHPHNRHQL